MSLNDPMPQEPLPTEGRESCSAAGDRWRTTRLSREAIAVLRQSLVRQQHRRHMFRAGLLRV
jgi:hypothetical protein